MNLRTTICIALTLAAFSSVPARSQPVQPAPGKTLEERMEALAQRYEQSADGSPKTRITGQISPAQPVVAATPLPIDDITLSGLPDVDPTPTPAPVPFFQPADQIRPAAMNGTPDSTKVLAAIPLDSERGSTDAEQAALPPETEMPPTALPWVLDPRQQLDAGIVSKDGYESTGLKMQRVVVFAGYKKGSEEPLWTQREEIDIPVVHKTRRLSLTPERVTKLKEALKLMDEVRKEADALETKAKKALEMYNAIVDESTPHEVLSADSPSLTTNQSGTALNRAKAKPGFNPGDGLTIKIEE